MALRPLDRRGLGEIVAWSCASFMVGLVAIVKMITHQGEVDGVLMGQFVAIITILVARGTQGAAERSAKQESPPTPLPPPLEPQQTKVEAPPIPKVFSK
jgi:hypothetical protein